MSTKGLKFFWDKRISDEAVIRFLKKEKEKLKLVKVSNNYFKANSIKSLLRKFLCIIMEYITLDGRFTRVYGYHFSLLNHFRHKVRVSLPHYLFHSLSNSLDDHKKNPKINHILHTGLIGLIYEHFQNMSGPSDPIVVSTSEDYGTETSGSDDKSLSNPKKIIADPPSLFLSGKKT